MQKFLRQYRATPHSTTGMCPHKLLFNRDPITKLPTVFMNESNNIRNPCLEELLHRNDDVKKSQMKLREDKKTRATGATKKQIGDYVILENEVRGKLTPTYDVKPYKIVSKKGSMVTAKRGEREVTRDSSRFKPVSFDVPNNPTKEEDDEDLKVNLPPAFDEPKDPMKRDEDNSMNSNLDPQSKTEKRTPTPQSKNPTEEPVEVKPHKKLPYATVQKSVSFNSPPVRRSERIRKTPTFLSDYCVERKYTGNKKRAQ